MWALDFGRYIIAPGALYGAIGAKNLEKNNFRDISIPSIYIIPALKTPKYDIYMQSYVDLLT